MSGPTIHNPESTQVVTYRTWDEYLTAFDGIDGTWGTPAWAGSASVADAVAIARRGWPEGAQYVRDIAMPALASATVADVHAEGWTYDVTGAAYDVGEYLSGVPECWLTPETRAAKPVIRIMANIAVSAGVPVEAIRLRGAAVAALAFHLQSTGYAVEVSTVWAVAGWGRDKPSASRVIVTDAQGGPLDMDRLLFALAHPSAGRQLGHTMVGAGVPTDDMPEAWDKPDLYLPCLHLAAADWRNLDSVTKWIECTYKTLTNS